ncbi:hypothetical protein ALC56_08558 [Trachymyrmex septentrionalis]|uniref:Uncharacterized protein n=1 Tax=Trachymyrmex septentrionalis TaxID=34720 RepID=A0A195F981_9HYME|nr:hypothetical protein ALC56_08558 [Trachymyrmex septentrionalis]
MPVLRTRLEYNGNVKSEDLEVLTVNAAKRASVNTILPLLTDFSFIHSLLRHGGFSRPSAESPVVRIGYLCTSRDILERVRGVCSSLIKPKETERERGRAPSIFASLFQAEAG